MLLADVHQVRGVQKRIESGWTSTRQVSPDWLFLQEDFQIWAPCSGSQTKHDSYPPKLKRVTASAGPNRPFPPPTKYDPFQHDPLLRRPIRAMPRDGEGMRATEISFLQAQRGRCSAASTWIEQVDGKSSFLNVAPGKGEVLERGERMGSQVFSEMNIFLNHSVFAWWQRKT